MTASQPVFLTVLHGDKGEQENNDMTGICGFFELPASVHGAHGVLRVGLLIPMIHQKEYTLRNYLDTNMRTTCLCLKTLNDIYV